MSYDPLLSAILIVKNEEKRLTRSLAPLKAAGCEIIVTDTGSTDRTVEIAKEYGATIFNFPWNGDESAARNVSLQNARGRWVFWVDADEIVDDELVASIIADLPRIDADSQIQTLSVVMRNVYQGGSTSLTPMMRMARRRSDLRFEGAIHPQLNFRPEIGNLRGILLHEGYQWTPELRKRKSAHMRAHLEPLCQGEKPPFNRWCELLSVLLIGDDQSDFERYWKKRSDYSEDEKYRGSHAHYWQENSTNILLFLSRQERWEEGMILAEELLSHYPDQIAAHFFRIQNAVRLREWSQVRDRVLRIEVSIRRLPQFYNTYYPEIHGESARLWGELAEVVTNGEKRIQSVRLTHPREISTWLYLVIHFPDRIDDQDKWGAALVRWIHDWKAGKKESYFVLDRLEKLIPLFSMKSLERAAGELFQLALISSMKGREMEVIHLSQAFLERYPEVTSLGKGFQKMEQGNLILLEWFYEEGLHRV